MGDNFSFLLPLMMAIFGIAFLIAWRSGARPALFWGLGYLAGALAFLCPIVLGSCSDAVQSVVEDALFAATFFCFGQALRLRFARPRALLSSALLFASAVAASALSVLWFASLRLELAGVQIACSLPLVLVLASIRRSLHHPIDRALAAVAALMVLTNVLSGLAAPLTTATDDLGAYARSTYAFVQQASAMISGLVFGLVALVSVLLDVVARYRNEALTDPLTGLWNRRGFEVAAPDLAKVSAEGSIITCDIDHFKQVNDRLGHAAGDRVIMTVAELLQVGLPAGAVVARFGGEEFIVYLPTPQGEAHLLADQLCRTIADQASAASGVEWPLTASFGIAEIDMDDASLHDAIARADRRLYDAKLAGRNRVRGIARAA